jgi:hypothetical protein
MSKKDQEEEIFDKLMESKSMSNQEIFEKYKEKVKEGISKYDDVALSLFLREKLGTSFNKIKGAWDQYSDKEINRDDFIMSGVFVLGAEFVDIFIGEPPSPEMQVKRVEVSKEEPVLGLEFSENPFAQNDTSNEVKPELIEKWGVIGKVIPDEEIVIIKDPVPKVKPAPIEEPTPIKKPIQEEKPTELSDMDLQIQIPDLLFDDFEKEVVEELSKTPEFDGMKLEPAETKAIPTVKPLSPQVFSPKKPQVKPLQLPKAVKQLEKIEHVAPEKKVRSPIDALHTVGVALDKVKLEPLKFDKVSDSELKSVNVGAQLPGTLLYDLFNEARDLIYDEDYDTAIKKLEKIRENAEINKDDEAYDRAVEMMANVSAYKMIQVLIDAGDKIINEPRKATEKYKKALGFAKTLKDDHYLIKIRKRLNSLSQSVSLMLAKKDFESKEQEQLEDLLRQNIFDLSKKEALMSIEEIMKYCNNKNEDFVMTTLVNMIQNGEVFAKFFPDSKKVMFDKEANKDAIRLKIKF